MSQPLFHRLPGGVSPSAVPEEARPFLGALLDAPGWGVVLLDRQLRPVWVNGTMATLSELPASVHVGRALPDLWPQLAPTLSPLLARAQEDEEVREVPVKGVLGASGTERHLRVSVVPAVNGGVPAGLVLWVRDETDTVEESLRLKEREEHMRGLADVACDGHFLHDNGHVLDANRALAHLLGHEDPSELIGHHMLEWVAPEFRGAVTEVVARGVETPYEAMCLRKDGQRIPLEVLGRHVTWEGRRVRMAAVWDLSSRKAAEERTAGLEQFREQLLGSVGQALRAPLESLERDTGALRGEVEPPERQRLVAQVARAGRRMEKMIHELLDYTRARLSGGLTLHPESMSLAWAVEPVVARRRQAWPGRQMLLGLEGDLRGCWDGERLEDLTDHLLGAVLNGPPDSPVELHLMGSVGGVILSLSNPALSIPLEDLATLFEPLCQRRHAGGEGLGLGLYLARQIAAAHGGRLTAETHSPGGTRFTVWLPREAPL